MSNKVNPDLYDFLKENETGLYKLNHGEVTAYVHINFRDIEEFNKIIGSYWFEEGGLDVKMFYDTVCIDLNDIFESEDNTILDYKKCFNENDIEYYFGKEVDK